MPYPVWPRVRGVRIIWKNRPKLNIFHASWQKQRLICSNDLSVDVFELGEQGESTYHARHSAHGCWHGHRLQLFDDPYFCHGLHVALYCLVNTDKHGAEEANEGLDQGHVAAITAAIAKFENDKLNK